MSLSQDFQGSGGFLYQTEVTEIRQANGSAFDSPWTLPETRSSPLKPGSSKESGFIDFVDQKLLGISRRYEKRLDTEGREDRPSSDTRFKGYREFDEVAKELDPVINAVWVSGTPSLQKPYFLTIALAISSYLPSFSFSPSATFKLLQKLDLAISSLLHGINEQTRTTLSGFEGGKGKFSTTEMVRIRGIVERTRVAIVEVAGREGGSVDASSHLHTETETDEDWAATGEDDAIDKHRGSWEMEIARVYEKTLIALGAFLEASDFNGSR